MWDQKEELDELAAKDNRQSDINGDDDNQEILVDIKLITLILDIGDKLEDLYQNLVSEQISNFFYKLTHREKLEESHLQIPCPICGGYHSGKDCAIENEKESINNHK